MNRSIVLAVALTIATVSVSVSVTVPALADTQEGRGEGPRFPVAAAEFHSHVEARLTRRREHLEAMIMKKNVDAAKAQEMRARFDEASAKVEAEVAKVTADGVVTADEAKEVRETARAVFPHHHDGERGGQGQPREPHDASDAPDARR